MKLFRLMLVAFMATVALWGFIPSVRPAAAADVDTKAESPNFVPDIKFPGLFESEPQDSQLMGKYFRAVYIYMVYVIGVLATVMLIYGGIKWVAAAGNASQINDAKDVITNSVIGLVIGLTSFLLLNIINPQLLSLSLPDTPTVTTKYFSGAHVKGVCSAQTQRDNKVDCGNLYKTGTEKNQQGENVDTFCMGTRCDLGNWGGLSGDLKVCNILYDAKTKYYAKGAGCISKMPAVYKTATTPELPVKSEAGSVIDTIEIDPRKLDWNLVPECGTVSSTMQLGIRCNQALVTEDVCYMTGHKAEFPRDQIKEGTLANNFFCPAAK